MSDFLSETFEKLTQYGMLPKVNFAENKLKSTVQSFLKAALPVMLLNNVTTEDFHCIKQLHDEYPELLLGITGKFSKMQVQQAALNGVAFIVFEDFDESVCAAAIKLGILPIPSIEEVSQAQKAASLGIKTAHIEVRREAEIQEKISSFENTLHLVMSGREFEDKLLPYLARHEIAGCLSSFDDLKQDDEELSVRIQKKLMSFFKLHIAHVGLNTTSHKESLEQANILASVLQLGVREGKKSAFAGSLFELMYAPFYYEKGHIALGCADASRAYHYFKRRHIEFIEDTVSKDPNGNIIAAYFKQNFAGFGIHLLWEKQKN